MKVSVIIPVYNRAQTLRRAVRSLLAQANDADLDILIVDDGSNDDTPDVIAELTSTHDCVRSVTRENGGVTAARNTGLEHLPQDADIVTFLDSDDALAPARFAADLPHFHKNPEIDVTYGRLVATNQLNEQTLQPVDSANSHEVIVTQLSCALFRKRLIDRIGLFDTDLKHAEDVDYLLRVFESGAKFIQTDTICVFYVRHPGNMSKQFTESRRFFALALLKSLRRRQADPSLKLDKPDFDPTIPLEMW